MSACSASKFRRNWRCLARLAAEAQPIAGESASAPRAQRSARVLERLTSQAAQVNGVANAPEVSASVAFSASLIATPSKLRKPPSRLCQRFRTIRTRDTFRVHLQERGKATRG